MSEHQINHLGDIVKQILNVMQKFQEQIVTALNHLKQLPELVKKVLEGISESANRQIQAAGEMEIIKKMANLNSKKHLISAEQEAITDFKSQLDEDIQYIKKQYDKIDAELNQEAGKRVRAIDAHLLSLPDYFPSDFIQAYSQNITPLLEKLRSDNELSNKERQALIEKALNQVIDSINQFQESREDFFNKIDHYQQEEVLADQISYYLPMWIFGKDGKKHVFTPGSVTYSKVLADGYRHFSPEKSLKNYYDHMTDASNSHNLNEILDALPWEKDSGEAEKLEKRLLDYAQTHLPSNKRHVKRAVKKILKDSEVKRLNNS